MEFALLFDRWLSNHFATGKAYRGINVFLLGSLRYTSPHFLTYKQALELGSHVKKGEKGALVVKYGTYTNDDAQTAGTELLYPLNGRPYL